MRRFETPQSFRTGAAAHLGRGPIAIILAEDATEVDSTLAHHARLGFSRIVLCAPEHVQPGADPPEGTIRLKWRPGGQQAVADVVNCVIDTAPGNWMYYGFNAEYLFFPFCETRSIGEMLAFHTEERRDAMLTFVVDLYAGNLKANPAAVSRADAHMDRSGYYALARPDPANHGQPMERQFDFFGGLRWRFEEHVPEDSRRIDRIGLFRAKPGLRLLPNHTFSDPEYNTYACPWHHNLTATICSFRAAKALRLNAGSRRDVTRFTWRNSVPFEWHSQQLLDLGLMEPGQWF